MEKSTLVIERLKAGKVPNFTVCGKQFQTLMTLSVKISRTSPINIDRFRKFYTDTFPRQFAINRSVKIPRHLKRVATLPCEIYFK